MDLSWTEYADVSCTPTVAPPPSASGPAPSAAVAPAKSPAAVVPGTPPAAVLPSKPPAAVVPGKSPAAVVPGKPPAAVAPAKLSSAVAPVAASNAAPPRTKPPAPAPALAPESATVLAAKSDAATAGGSLVPTGPLPVSQAVASRTALPPAAAALSSDDGAASLAVLLQRLNLSELSDLLKKHMVKDVGTLGMLSTEEMAEIGVPLGARKKLQQALHPPAERKTAEGVGVCVVCLERDSVCLARECGHKAVCEVCVRPLKRCPICRRETEFLKIYDQ